MESLSSPSNLLILTPKEEDAEAIVTALRNGGIATRGIYTGDLQRVAELVTAHPFALILCCDFNPSIDLDACLRSYRELRVDTPLVVIADPQTDPSELVAAMRGGARDLVRHGDVDHLQLVVARELKDYRNRRLIGRLHKRLQECEQRAQGKTDASGEASPLTARTEPGMIDTDTGLPNRAAFMTELARRLSRKGADATTVAILYLGVDLFSRMIQNEGLTAGLEAVAEVGATLRRAVPANAYLARVGDDAFTVLVDDLSQSDAMDLSGRIVDGVRQSAPSAAVGSGERACGTGIMLAEPGKNTAADALDTVYRDYLFGAAVPDQGISSSSHSLPNMPESGYHSELSEERRGFAARIRQALEGDGFQLVYQPIVSLKGDSQENYSVFIRLRDDEKRLREAKEFLAAAVQTGRMVAIDRWVIRHAIEELAKQRAQERKLNFFINIAEETLQEGKLLIWICDYLREYSARGSWLTFQILEEHARHHMAAFTKLSEGLKKVKCRVALNRFGLGPNPETLLKNLRADFIKLAPELAAGLADDEGKQKRLHALADAARQSGMRSVFTGVEDARTLTVLWTAGIDYVQGNFLQKPLPCIEPV